MKLIRFLKDWALVDAIIAGIVSYFIVSALPLSVAVKTALVDGIGVLQPVLIFSMLFLTFCKIDLRQLHFCRWHLWLLLIQCGVFAGLGCLLIAMPHSQLRVVLEGAMICMICPTATAGAVITGKLGGNVRAITTYTILINLATALLIPALVPFVHPDASMSVWHAALLILLKVFPLLLLPLVAAALLRYFRPDICARVARYQELSFYLWMVALALALAVTTRSIVNTHLPVSTQLWLVAVSLLCCTLQFYLGRRIGGIYGDAVTAGQSFGQKNTVLAIWLGYTFFTPVTAIVGGFYSIWHNLVNSYQLYRHQHPHSHNP